MVFVFIQFYIGSKCVIFEVVSFPVLIIFPLQVVSILRGHSKKVTSVVYHPADELVFTGSPDATVRVWGVEQGQCASVIRAHKGAVTGLSVHATGDYLLSSSADGQWAFSDLRHGRVLVRISALDKSGTQQCKCFMVRSSYRCSICSSIFEYVTILKSMNNDCDYANSLTS